VKNGAERCAKGLKVYNVGLGEAFDLARSAIVNPHDINIQSIQFPLLDIAGSLEHLAEYRRQVCLVHF